MPPTVSQQNLFEYTSAVIIKIMQIRFDVTRHRTNTNEYIIYSYIIEKSGKIRKQYIKQNYSYIIISVFLLFFLSSLAEAISTFYHFEFHLSLIQRYQKVSVLYSSSNSSTLLSEIQQLLQAQFPFSKANSKRNCRLYTVAIKMFSLFCFLTGLLGMNCGKKKRLYLYTLPVVKFFLITCTV